MYYIRIDNFYLIMEPWFLPPFNQHIFHFIIFCTQNSHDGDRSDESIFLDGLVLRLFIKWVLGTFFWLFLGGNFVLWVVEC